jgi:WD40 repeat protein
MRAFKGHKGKVFALAFSPDGQTLASGSADHHVMLWDPTTGERRADFAAHTSGGVLALAFSPDGRTLASGGSDDTVRLWGMPDGNPLATLRADARGTGVWMSLAFSPGGDLLAAGDIGWGDAGSLALWDVATQKRSRHVEFSSGKVWDVAFAPGGDTLAVAVQGQGVTLWDWLADTQRSFQTAAVARSIAWSPDGRLLGAGVASSVELWDVASGERVATRKVHESLVWSVRYTPDGEALLAGSKDGTVSVWDGRTAEPRGSFNWDVGKLNAVAVAPDGMTAAAAGAKRFFVVWDLA